MDFLKPLMEGNNPILILLAFLLFKDQIFSLFKPKPAEPVPAVPLPSTPGPAVPVSPDRPVLDLVKDLLPVLLPLLLPTITQLVKEQKDLK